MKTKFLKAVISAMCALTTIFTATSMAVYAEGETGTTTTTTTTNTTKSGGSVETVNNIGMGNVSISLNEYKVDASGKETPIPGNSDQKVVMPGETISKLSKITVNASKSWIRAKVMVSGDKEIKDLDEKWVRLVEDKHWVKKGDYYYYNEPVDHGKTISFTKDVVVPLTEEEEVANKKFNIIIWADAVQYANFKPNFNSDNPWFGTVIETSAYTTYKNKEAGKAGLTVAYEGGAQGLVANTADAFKNFGTLMPGDKVSDSIKIGNSYTQPVRLFFRIDSIDNEKLAKQVTLKIKAGNVEIFNGTLASAMKEIYLAYMTPGYSAVLTYELNVPSDLKDEYELTNAKQKWVFRAELGDSVIPADPANYTPGNTSDPNNMMKYVYVLGGCLAVAVVAGAAIAATKKKEEKE